MNAVECLCLSVLLLAGQAIWAMLRLRAFEAWAINRMADMEIRLEDLEREREAKQP